MGPALEDTYKGLTARQVSDRNAKGLTTDLVNEYNEYAEQWNGRLEEWIVSVLSHPHDPLLMSWQFPTDELRDLYLEDVQERPEGEVRALVREFLIPTGSLGLDHLHREWLELIASDDPEEFTRLAEREFFRRLMKHDIHQEPTWQGITWLLDLLPHWPRKALAVFDAYFMAHAPHLPDGRIHGIADAEAVIRAKWIGTPRSVEGRILELQQLSPRDFEYLVAALYDAMGYSTEVTGATRDGGRDVIASKPAPAKERLLIDCKLRTHSVGIRDLRHTLGAVSHEKANKGVLVTNTRFTKPARTFASENDRIELIDGSQAILLMNEYLGSLWPAKIGPLIRPRESTGPSNRSSSSAN